MQLSFDDIRRRRGPRLAVLPDAARVEDRLGRLAREQRLVASRVAVSVAELERQLVAGLPQRVAPREVVLLAVHEAGGPHSLSRALWEGRELDGRFGRALSSARASLERAGLL